MSRRPVPAPSLTSPVSTGKCPPLFLHPHPSQGQDVGIQIIEGAGDSKAYFTVSFTYGLLKDDRHRHVRLDPKKPNTYSVRIRVEMVTDGRDRAVFTRKGADAVSAMLEEKNLDNPKYKNGYQCGEPTESWFSVTFLSNKYFAPAQHAPNLVALAAAFVGGTTKQPVQMKTPFKIATENTGPDEHTYMWDKDPETTQTDQRIKIRITRQ